MEMGMGSVIAGMTMSLDGYVGDREGSVALLYRDFDAMVASELLQESMRTTGAVVMGRRMYDMGQDDFTGYEFQVPIFIITHHPPETPAKGENANLKFHFITDGVDIAIRRAKAAAGERNVTIVGGAEIIRKGLKAGLVDELHIDIVPVLLNGGQRLFEEGRTEPRALEIIQVDQSAGRTSLQYRVVK
jgi:dihydrofolate reductase